MKSPRVHFHTDNEAFSGCEQMLVVLIGEGLRTGRIYPSLSYRMTDAYEAGIAQRLPFPIDKTALLLPDTSRVSAWTKARFSSKWAWPIKAFIQFILVALPIRQIFQVYDIFVLRRLIRSVNPDIVHINNGGFPGAASCTSAAIAARLAGVRRIVYVVNNQAYSYTTPQRWYEYPLEQLAVRCVSRFVTGSKASASRLGKVLSLPTTKRHSIHNGIAERAPDESFEQTRKRLAVEFDHILIVCVGRLEARKGHRYAIEAFGLLLAEQRASKVTLLIEGDGPQKDSLQKQIDRLGARGQIRIVPPERNVWNLYQACDIVVLPSVSHEDFPNVVLEAMANAKPVIASDIAGVPEQVIHGETGLLVPPRDHRALAEAMARLIESEELRREMGHKGRLRFEDQFTAETAAKRYFDLYDELLRESF